MVTKSHEPPSKVPNGQYKCIIGDLYTSTLRPSLSPVELIEADAAALERGRHAILEASLPIVSKYLGLNGETSADVYTILPDFQWFWYLRSIYPEGPDCSRDLKTSEL